jgi:hypothetical protein
MDSLGADQITAEEFAERINRGIRRYIRGWTQTVSSTPVNKQSNENDCGIQVLLNARYNMLNQAQPNRQAREKQIKTFRSVCAEFIFEPNPTSPLNQGNQTTTQAPTPKQPPIREGNRTRKQTVTFSPPEHKKQAKQKDKPLKEKWLEIRESRVIHPRAAGFGLFSIREKPIPPKKTLGVYTGEALSRAEGLARRDAGGEYLMETLEKGEWIDGEDPALNPKMRFINSTRGSLQIPNAEFRHSAGQTKHELIEVTSTRAIRCGEEILIYYELPIKREEEKKNKAKRPQSAPPSTEGGTERGGDGAYRTPTKAGKRRNKIPSNMAEINKGGTASPNKVPTAESSDTAARARVRPKRPRETNPRDTESLKRQDTNSAATKWKQSQIGSHFKPPEHCISATPAGPPTPPTIPPSTARRAAAAPAAASTAAARPPQTPSPPANMSLVLSTSDDGNN